MKSLIVIICSLFCTEYLYGASAFRNGQVITFTWEKFPTEKETDLELKFNHPSARPKLIKVKGNTFDLRLKKMPEKIFWRVRNADFQELILTQKFFLKTGGGIENANYAFESETFDEKGSASGNSIFFAGEYFPEFFKGNKSFRLGYTSAAMENKHLQFDKKEFTFEVSQMLKHRTNHHQLYLGYYLYTLDFSSETDQAEYIAHFISLKYLFRKHLSQKFDFEFLASLRIPYPVRFNPSGTIRPSFIYKWNANLGLETFVYYDKFSARESDKNLNQVVELNSSSFGAGAGLIVRF